jgi:hypothetical protein
MADLKRDRMSAADAEALAIEALGFLAGDPERLGAFLSETGLGPADMRAVAGEPGFLAAVIEHIMSDDGLVLAFAEHARIRPTLIAVARHHLSRIVEE